jgi:hypothetical protein
MSLEYGAIEVKVIKPYELWVKCADGVSGTIRFLTSRFRNVFAGLADFNKFSQVYLDNGAITWNIDNQIVDIAPDRVYDELKSHTVWELK